MNFGSNFNDRKLFTRQEKSTTRSIDMNRYNNNFGARSIDEVRMSRIKLKDQLNGNQKENLTKNIDEKNSNTNTQQHFNHIEAMRNIKRGI